MLIAENDDYLIYHQEGHRAPLIITFSHMEFAKTNRIFWGDTLLDRLGFTSLGIVCKRDNWYPSSLRTLEPHFAEILSNYTERLCYGFSMGGYGAIKYSRLFQATHVLALSPQYSIDPKDLDGATPWFSGHLSQISEPSMSIKSSEIAGSVGIIFDPYESHDEYAVRKINAISPHIYRLPVSHVGHNTIHTISRGGAFAHVVDSILRNDWATVHRTLLNKRDTDQNRMMGLISHVAQKKPSLLLKLSERCWPLLDNWPRGQLKSRHPQLANFPE
jgi:hypothetical protein